MVAYRKSIERPVTKSSTSCFGGNYDSLYWFSQLFASAYFVLPQKFRAGGYNVIVATSIGEEGLDIMEVDLVICFDANVSPLRMIQRMGRTGRKHDGRVDILFVFWIMHYIELVGDQNNMTIFFLLLISGFNIFTSF